MIDASQFGTLETDEADREVDGEPDECPDQIVPRWRGRGERKGRLSRRCLDRDGERSKTLVRDDRSCYRTLTRYAGPLQAAGCRASGPRDKARGRPRPR